MTPHYAYSGRFALLAAVLLCFTGCPERPINRGTDVPEKAGERFTKDVDGGGNPSGKDTVSAAAESDKQARESHGNAPAPTETPQ